MDAGSLYINFVMHAVVGKLGEADIIYRNAKDAIHHCANALARYAPIVPKPIYRGVLVDPDLDFKADPAFTFMSWSEDRDVARWFASPNSYISRPFLEHVWPSIPRGLLLTLEAPRSRVLFHHSWANLIAHPRTLGQLAMRHPFMGAEGMRQIDWSISTQQEVITAPVDPLPEALPIESVEGVSVDELDLKLTPSWLTAEERAS